MKALIFRNHGDLDTLEYADTPEPVVGPHEALIHVKAAALNHLDLWVRRGIPGLRLPLPHIGGSDLAGIVIAVGEDVPTNWIGQRVLVNPALSCGTCHFCLAGQQCMCPRFRILGEHTPGGFAEYTVAPALNLHPIPDDYPLTQAAAAPLVFQTAWRALITQAQLRAGESILIIGAGGGVATAAIQIARHAGAYIYAVTSSPEKEQRALALGAHETINYRETDFAKEIWRRTDKLGVDIVLENVGPSTWTSSIRALKPGGRLVTYGATTGRIAETDLNLLFWKQIHLIGSTMATYTEFADVMHLILNRQLHPVIDRILPLHQGREAHRILETGEQFGKIVLEIPTT